MATQHDAKVDAPQGPAKWIGYAVGAALLLMALVVGIAIFASLSESTASSDSATQQSSPQPSADDEALRRSLGK
jgi:hypothetical protein